MIDFVYYVKMNDLKGLCSTQSKLFLSIRLEIKYSVGIGMAGVYYNVE